MAPIRIFSHESGENISGYFKTSDPLDLLVTLVKPFSDLPLEEICSSKCQEEYMECSSTCEGPECLSDCNRESIACTDCKLRFKIKFILNDKISVQKSTKIFSVSMSYRLH